VQTSTNATLNTCKQILRNNYKIEWLNQWASAKTGRTHFNEQDRPHPQDPIRLLNRNDQSLVFQLRTGHATVNGHLHRIDPARNPNCRHCLTNMETVQYLLLHCPQLSDLRRQLLPSLPSIYNTLYTSATQLRNTTHFAHSAMSC
jgi:hypothetical protein